MIIRVFEDAVQGQRTQARVASISWDRSFSFHGGSRINTAANREIPGHWEGVLVAGGKNSYIATLVRGILVFSCWSKCRAKKRKRWFLSCVSMFVNFR